MDDVTFGISTDDAEPYSETSLLRIFTSRHGHKGKSIKVQAPFLPALRQLHTLSLALGRSVQTIRRWTGSLNRSNLPFLMRLSSSLCFSLDILTQGRQQSLQLFFEQHRRISHLLCELSVLLFMSSRRYHMTLGLTSSMMADIPVEAFLAHSMRVPAREGSWSRGTLASACPSTDLVRSIKQSKPSFIWLSWTFT